MRWPQFLSNQLGVPVDHDQQVIEIVRDAGFRSVMSRWHPIMCVCRPARRSVPTVTEDAGDWPARGRIEIENLWLENLPSAEREQLPNEVRGAPGGGTNFVEITLRTYGAATFAAPSWPADR
jgi:hypothetical protein